MKRSPMPARRSPLMRGPGPQPKTRLRPVSAKRRRQTANYNQFRSMVADERGEMCQVCPALNDAGIESEFWRAWAQFYGVPWWRHETDHLHHRRKQSDLGARMLRANVLLCCDWANGWIEDNPALVRETPSLRHLCVRQGDPEWEQLGRKAK